MCAVPGTGNGSGQWIKIGDEKYQLIYSMLSLEKIEAQFGSVAEMQQVITDDQGNVTLDRPVVKMLIDIIHAGLLHEFDDTAEGRRKIGSAMRPAELNDVVEAFTLAFTDAFGSFGEAVMAGEAGGSTTPNRATRRAASHGSGGTTSPLSSSAARKKSGKK